MKKILTCLLGLLGLVGVTGCDKIEPEEYTVYDGAVVNWYKSDFPVEPVQRVYVEKYTGPKCSNCPLADETLATIHNDNVIMVSINHPTGQGVPFPNQPDMRTDGGTVWDNYFGINAIPAAYINRNQTKQYLGSMVNIVSDIGLALNELPTVALTVSANAIGGRVNVLAEMTFVEKYESPVTLTVIVVEDSLNYKQMLPDGSINDEYVHNHMLRKVITGYWGSDVKANGSKGESVSGELSFTFPTDINSLNSHIVAFVSDKQTRKVLNCASCKMY